jgi:hypothetical protein
MLMKRGGHTHTHEEAFFRCRGLQIAQFSPHCSGKLSHLLNALALSLNPGLKGPLRITSILMS